MPRSRSQQPVQHCLFKEHLRLAAVPIVFVVRSSISFYDRLLVSHDSSKQAICKGSSSAGVALAVVD
jgi:hypothetical protein